ncbi:hypothetical protein TNCV_716151 [Trichonephila clavipes]|nr:hypothetical protein TNCV_716151 [Trichonephila clavipes]
MLYAMIPHTITPVSEVVCRCIAKYYSFEHDNNSDIGNGEWMSMAVQVIGAAIATVLRLCALRGHGLTQKPAVKMFVYRWEPRRQSVLCLCVL